MDASTQADIEKLEAEAAKLRAETAVIQAREDKLQAAAIEKLWTERDLIAAQGKYHAVGLFTTATLAGAGLLAAGATLYKLLLSK